MRGAQSGKLSRTGLTSRSPPPDPSRSHRSSHRRRVQLSSPSQPLSTWSHSQVIPSRPTLSRVMMSLPPSTLAVPSPSQHPGHGPHPPSLRLSQRPSRNRRTCTQTRQYQARQKQTGANMASPSMTSSRRVQTRFWPQRNLKQVSQAGKGLCSPGIGVDSLVCDRLGSPMVES